MLEQLKESEPGYYAITPAEVRYDEELCPNAKLLYGEITALCNKFGFCYASNNYFAKLYKVHKNTISEWISQLKKKDYISVEIFKKREGFDRKIYIKKIVSVPRVYVKS